MLQKIKDLKDREEGFTIIEVLIVLAIAGLIMLIVFLAVPALQRNTRNNGRKNDAGRISTAINDFVSNGQGALPDQADWTANAKDCAAIVQDAGNLSQYNSLTCTAGNAPTTPGANTFYEQDSGTVSGKTANNNVLILSEQAQCSGSSATVAGTARQAALLYSLESGGGYAWSCLNVQ